MAETIRGLATRVDIAREYLPDIPVDLLTRASPAVANTLAPHGLVAGDCGYFIAARGDIDGQAALVAQTTSTTWVCEQLNTSRMRQFPLGLLFRPVRTWVQLYAMSRFAYSEGERQPLNATLIDMQRERERPGTPKPFVAQFGVVPQTTLGDGMTLLHDVADAAGALLFRVTLQDRAIVLFRGQPTRAPGVDLSAGEIASGDTSVLVHGVVIRQRNVPAPTYVELALGGAVVELEF